MHNAVNVIEHDPRTGKLAVLVQCAHAMLFELAREILPGGFHLAFVASRANQVEVRQGRDALHILGTQLIDMFIRQVADA